MRISNIKQLPSWNQTITIFSKQNNWQKTIVENCAYACTAVSSATGATLNIAAQYLARVPTLSTTALIAVGDIVIKGVADETVIQNASTILQKYKTDAFVVKTILNNSQIGIGAHYCLRGG